MKQNNVKLQTHLDEEFAGKVIKAQGIASTSAYIRAVLQQHFRNNPDGHLNLEGIV